MPTVLHLSANSPKVFSKLSEILVTYGKEVSFDRRLISLITDIVTKVHRASANPIDLYPWHLQPLVTLLLMNPSVCNEKSRQIIADENPLMCHEKSLQMLSDQIYKNFMDIIESYPEDAVTICVLFSPWLGKLKECYYA